MNPLHGQDLTSERTPIQAGLGWACALEKEFPGVEVMRREREVGPEERLVAFVMEEKAIPRHGMRILEGGEVTSGGIMTGLPPGLRGASSEMRADAWRTRGRPSMPTRSQRRS
jgi:aminomethyltransferase